MIDLKGKRIVVTGGAGFLGREVCRQLLSEDPDSVFVPRSANYDLRDRQSIRRLLLTVQPEIVIHLAAVAGGIQANRRNPGRYFYENAIAGIELIEQSRLLGVAKMVLVGAVASYPEQSPLPLRETDLWNGYPAADAAAFGVAKRMLFAQAQAYRQQYGFNAIMLVPVNLYGPGDHFDRDTSHVVPALIRKVIEAQEAGQEIVEVWGSGKATRDFLFVRDAARAIVLGTQRYDGGEPVNVATGDETTIRDLAKTICSICGYHGHLRFDPQQPQGRLRCCADTTRAEQCFGFQASTPLTQGLSETIAWFKKHRHKLPDRKAA